MSLEKYLIPKVKPEPNKNCVIQGSDFRITVLTPEMLRIETINFTDNATQAVWFRNFDEPKFTLNETTKNIVIQTKKVVFYYNKNKNKIDKVKFLLDNRLVNANNSDNLKGTYRTLDFTSGWTSLSNGIISKSGVSIYDDSQSLLLCDGEVQERESKGKDIYIFAYNKDFRKALFDFYQLTGKAPLVPRYALGNWWSRYRAYTQNEYISLMERFKNEDVPITVATIDMDWHWVDVRKQFSLPLNNKDNRKIGWTGYSWNTELFPDYKAFLQYLQQNNYKVTLNLHPAQGVSPFEDMYKDMAKELKLDSSNKETIPFDITNPNFINAYFKILHNPYEEEGVDFWWIDWQQGKKTKIEGLDPLWSLNHYHYLNSQRSNKRPLILSRFAKAGSHRYPLGFSGDAIISWASLRFQPYTTAIAANIGFTWWSHDIGGHMLGKKSDELYLRWLQFGVFSPINRLHSTSNDLQGKEPWNYSDITEDISKDWLRLRHSLIPYIYSMNYRSHSDGIALCEPMYYEYPEEGTAFECKNQYMFGSELLVAPVTSKLNKKLLMSKTKVWLPKGRWTDIFTGRIYEGDKIINMHRGLKSIPVLAKEGAIIPFGDREGNDCTLPKKLILNIYRGTSTTTLYEDDGTTMDFQKGKYATTEFSISQASKVEFVLNSAKGDISLLPKERIFELVFKDIRDGNIKVEKAGLPFEAYTLQKGEQITINFVCSPKDSIKIIITDCLYKENEDFLTAAINILSKYQGSNLLKMAIYKKLKNITTREEYINKVQNNPFMRKNLKSALLEVLKN